MLDEWEDKRLNAELDAALLAEQQAAGNTTGGKGLRDSRQQLNSCLECQREFLIGDQFWNTMVFTQKSMHQGRIKGFCALLSLSTSPHEISVALSPAVCSNSIFAPAITITNPKPL
jgi:hypothetical protein